METETARNRRGLLLVIASASVTMAIAVTAGALLGYIHPPPSAKSQPPEAAVTAPLPRTVLVPIRPDGPAAGLDHETEEPRLTSVRTDARRARRERDDDDRRHRHEEEDEDDD